MWDLNFLTRDWTQTPCIGRQSFNHWITREVLKGYFNLRSHCHWCHLVILCCCCSVTQLCPVLCHHMDSLSFTVCWSLLRLMSNELEFAQTHVQWVGDAIQPFHPLLSAFSFCPQSFFGLFIILFTNSFKYIYWTLCLNTESHVTRKAKRFHDYSLGAYCMVEREVNIYHMSEWEWSIWVWAGR